MTESQASALCLIGPIPILSIFFWKFRRRLGWKKRIVISIIIYTISFVTALVAVQIADVAGVGYLSPSESALGGIIGGILAPLA
ncbi:MAG: hypothetical protein DME53_02650, partial [Verrucomicrobia bacterium]